jgi:hypothetical protein
VPRPREPQRRSGRVLHPCRMRDHRAPSRRTLAEPPRHLAHTTSCSPLWYRDGERMAHSARGGLERSAVRAAYASQQLRPHLAHLAAAHPRGVHVCRRGLTPKRILQCFPALSARLPLFPQLCFSLFYKNCVSPKPGQGGRWSSRFTGGRRRRWPGNNKGA